MSCSENESSPYFMLFLPALVGFLTLLLARRWASTQVASTSSTAVSRRRKIIKDPLIKRPLPPITCKMVASGTKRSSGISKKFQANAHEEEMNGGKRVGKSKVTAQLNNTETKVNEGPVAPKHIPFPYIPQDSELLFETMTFIFTLVATGLQYLNLYRTVWWLPNSNTSQAMHFHLIDWHVVGFIVSILSRRLLFSVVHAAEQAYFKPKSLVHIVPATRMFVLGMVIGSMAWCASFIIWKYSYVLCFCLIYPAIIYFSFFGAAVEPFLELNNTSPLHCCSQDPNQIRTEVEVLRQDFNMRLKKILFNSVAGAYYSCFVPCIFAQSYVYYDVYGASEQTALVCVGLLLRYGAALGGAPHCDVLHRAAAHLGAWHISYGHQETTEILPWSPNRLYSYGNRVSACVAASGSSPAVVVAATACVAAQPFDSGHRRFYMVFSNPSNLLCFVLCLQLALISIQLLAMFTNTAWHNFLALVILLFINYYTVFKLLRDYLVSWKVYKAEHMIQDKNSTGNSIVN